MLTIETGGQLFVFMIMSSAMTDLLKTALEERRRLDKVIAYLQGDSTPTKSDGRRQTKKRKPMSAAARAKISAAQKKRWNEQKKA